MLNTKVFISFSAFAKYEFEKTLQFFPKYNKLAKEIIFSIKDNPFDMENTKKYRNHLLEHSENFDSLEGFNSFDIDKEKGLRFIWKIMYISKKDSNGNFSPEYSSVDSTNLSQELKLDIWKNILTEEDRCAEEKFVYVFVLNTCFSDHFKSGKLYTCSIDFLLHQIGIPEDVDSPFNNTDYSIQNM